eukprot:720709-Amphidinium_carterae.1
MNIHALVHAQCPCVPKGNPQKRGNRLSDQEAAISKRTTVFGSFDFFEHTCRVPRVEGSPFQDMFASVGELLDSRSSGQASCGPGYAQLMHVDCTNPYTPYYT